MRAIVLEAAWAARPHIRDLQFQSPSPAGCESGQSFWAQSIRLHTRLGLAQGLTFPRVLGIEAADVVARPCLSPARIR
jgi:hypothetical protein